MGWIEQDEFEDPWINKILHGHNKIMLRAASPNYGLIWRCRKHCETILQAYFSFHNHEVDDKDGLDGYLGRATAKKSLLPRMPDLIEADFNTVRSVGNIATHAKLEPALPNQLWSRVRQPITNITQWILWDVHNMKIKLMKEHKLENLFEVMYDAFVRENGDIESDGKFNMNLTENVIDKQLKLMDIFNSSLAPNMMRFCENLVDMSLNEQNGLTKESRKKLAQLAYQLSFWSPATANIMMLADFETLEGVDEEYKNVVKLFTEFFWPDPKTMNDDWIKDNL